MSTEPVSDLGVAGVRPGMRLGRYEILLGIAQGGMARVWAARQYGQRGFSKTVVIKTILPALASDREFENMFLDEARVAAGVHHPNVCEIFDLGEEDGTLYLAMEWVNGESLARVIKPPRPDGSPGDPLPIDPRVAARVIASASAGLHAAHELRDDLGNPLNVVHRDVSPQNILVSSTGNVKVTDFGVAKALGSLHEATMAGQVKGKAAYMSPEQASGRKVDRRSDIFALGICLYEATTGQRPFSGPNQVAVLKKVLDCDYRRPSEVIHGYPPALEQILFRAMQPDPEHRYQTADNMRLALEEWLATSGPVVSESKVGAVVQERVGHIVNDRHGRIRQLNASSSTMTGLQAPPQRGMNSIHTQQTSASSPSSVSHMRMVAAGATGQYDPVHVPPPSADGGGSAVTGALIGIGAGALLFIAVGGTWLALRPSTAPAAQPVPSGPVFRQLSSSDAPGPATRPDSEKDAPKEAESEIVQPVPTSAFIQLNAQEPKAGIAFFHDGKQITKGKVSRPEEGEPMVILARAEGHVDEKMRIDHLSPEIVDVFLKVDPDARKTPAKEPKPASSPKPASAPKPASRPKPSPRPKPKVNIPDPF